MLIQILLFVSIFFSYFISRIYKNPKKVFLILSGILIVFILGSRYCVNGYTDEVTYNGLYEGFSKLSWNQFWSQYDEVRDIGFYFVYWLMAKVIPWTQFPIYFITAFTIFSFFRFIYYNSDDELISVIILFVFIFSFFMAAYRQCFAMCFCLFAFNRAKKREPIGYVIFMLIAISMHRSAIAFIPVYFLMGIKRDNWGLLICVLSLIALMLLRRYLIQIAAEELDRDYTETLEFSLFGFIIQIIIMLVPFIIDGFMMSKWEENSLLQFRTKSVLAVGIVLYLSKFIAFAYERISYYYTFSVITAFSNSVARIKVDSKTLTLFKAIIIILCVALYFLRHGNNDLQFFWSV